MGCTTPGADSAEAMAPLSGAADHPGQACDAREAPATRRLSDLERRQRASAPARPVVAGWAAQQPSHWGKRRRSRNAAKPRKGRCGRSAAGDFQVRQSARHRAARWHRRRPGKAAACAVAWGVVAWRCGWPAWPPSCRRPRAAQRRARRDLWPVRCRSVRPAAASSAPSRPPPAGFPDGQCPAAGANSRCCPAAHGCRADRCDRRGRRPA